MAALTRLLTFPWSQAFATAYTYDLEAFSFVYMSAIFPVGRITTHSREFRHDDSLWTEKRLTLHQLECANWLTELLAIVDVFDRIVERGLHQSAVRTLVSDDHFRALSAPERTLAGHRRAPNAPGRGRT